MPHKGFCEGCRYLPQTSSGDHQGLPQQSGGLYFNDAPSSTYHVSGSAGPIISSKDEPNRTDELDNGTQAANGDRTPDYGLNPGSLSHTAGNATGHGRADEVPPIVTPQNRGAPARSEDDTCCNVDPRLVVLCHKPYPRGREYRPGLCRGAMRSTDFTTNQWDTESPNQTSDLSVPREQTRRLGTPNAGVCVVLAKDDTAGLAGLESDQVYGSVDDNGGWTEFCREEEYTIVKLNVDERGRDSGDWKMWNMVVRERGLVDFCKYPRYNCVRTWAWKSENRVYPAEPVAFVGSDDPEDGFVWMFRDEEGLGYLGIDELGGMQELGLSLVNAAEIIGGHVALAIIKKRSLVHGYNTWGFLHPNCCG